MLDQDHTSEAGISEGKDDTIGSRLDHLTRSAIAAIEDKCRPDRIEQYLLIGWVVVFVVVLLLAVDALIGAHGKDLSVYIYVAQGIPSGDIPYLDRWEHKGPFTYLLTLIGTFLGGSYGIWLLGIAFLLGSTWFAFKVVRDSFGTTAALVAITFFLFSFRRVADGGDLTEHYAMLFQCLTIFFFLRLRLERVAREPLICASIGALGAAAFLLRPNLIGVWLAIGFLWVIQLWWLRRREALRWITWAAAGGLTVLAVTAIVFSMLGALGAMWDAVIVYNLKYSGAAFTDRLGVLKDLRQTLMMVSLPLMVGWGIGLYYHFSGRAKGTSFERMLPLALILLPLETLLLATSGYQFNHYYVAVLPSAALNLAFLAWFVSDRNRTAPLLLITLLLMPVVYYNLPDYKVPFRTVTRIADKYVHASEITKDKYTKVAERVSVLTMPEDPVLAWGNQPQIYLQSGRDAPTRFFTQFPFISRSYADQGIRDEFVSGITSNRPLIIVDTGDGRLPPLDRDERRMWEPGGRRYMDLEPFQAFFDFVDSEYEAVEVVDGFTIYRLVDGT